jgi:hypothetical protein
MVSVACTHYVPIGTNLRVAVPNSIRDELNLVLPTEHQTTTGIGQFNVNNVFDRVTEQGTSERIVRYTNSRQIILTNTFSF